MDIYSSLSKVHCNAASTMPYDLSRFFFNLAIVVVLGKKRDQPKNEKKKREKLFL